MKGLGVILETRKDLPKYSTQIISKTSLTSSRNYYSLISCSSTSSSSSSSSSSSIFASPFLECCYYCHKRLQEGNDIYMYRGDRAFCSEECRCRQIFIDEDSGRRDNCSLAAAGAVAASFWGCPETRGSRRRAGVGKGRAVAGGFAS